MSTIWHVLRPSHPNQRGSTQSELKIFRCFSSFFFQLPLHIVYQLSHVTSWATESLILTFCIPSMDFTYLTAYMYFPTSASGYFPPLMYFRTFGLGCLIVHGAILTLLVPHLMPYITFIIELTALPIVTSLLSFFAIDRVTRNILSVWLVVPFWLVLLYPFGILAGAIWCDRMRTKIWVGSATSSLSKYFTLRVDFVLVDLLLLNWGVDCLAVTL